MRQSPFARESVSPSPGSSRARPKSEHIAAPQGLSSPNNFAHNLAVPTHRETSHASSNSIRHRTGSVAHNQASGTFAPKFIRSEQSQRTDHPVDGIEGENDFSGKRYVWLADPDVAFIRGWVVEELGDGRLLIQCDDGSVSVLQAHCLAKGLTLVSAARSPFGQCRQSEPCKIRQGRRYGRAYASQ